MLSCGMGLGIPGVEGGAAIGPSGGFAGGGLVGAGSKGTIESDGGGSLETFRKSSSVVRRAEPAQGAISSGTYSCRC